MALVRSIANAVLCLLIGAAIMLAILPPLPAFAVNDCTDPAYVRAFDPRLAGRRCSEIARIPIRWSGGIAHFRVLKTDDAPTESGVNATAWIRESAGRIGAAMDQMGALTIDDPTIMLTNLTYTTSSGASAWALVLGRQPYAGQCLAIAFRMGSDYDAELAKFVLSHEMFHCVQYATWPGSLASSGRDWWVEGAAEYFAHLAVPGTHYQDAFVRQFEERALTTSILDLSYHNVVFFSWLGGRSGPPGVKSFIDQVSRGRNREDYRRLAESALSPDVWKDFATAFVGNDIRLPGSSNTIGADWGRLPRHSTAEGTEFRLTAEPLVVLGAILQFTPAAKFRTHVESTPYGATREPGGEPWRPLPELIDLPCNQEWDYFIAATSANSRGAHVTIRANMVGRPRECTTCAAPATARRESCVVGTWRYVAPPRVCEKLIRLAKANNTAEHQTFMTECNTGQTTITFSADGSVSGEVTGSRQVTRTTTPGGTTTIVTKFNPRGTAGWSTSAGTLEFCGAKGTLNGSTTLSIRGVTKEVPANQPFGPANGRVQYTCTAGELRLRGEALASWLIDLNEMTLTRGR